VAGRETQATRAAKAAGIAFTVHEYEHDPQHESYGLEAVEALGQEPARVFKTLVAAADGRLVVCCVPVAAQLDLKAVAAAIGARRAEMADVREAERATGYVAGGISPLGQKRRLPTLVDESALTFDTIYVSAGRRGLEIELAPADLIRLTGGTSPSIAREPGQRS
jgi:Cys-tRNA(Pro)/Cys-tRNA(Cys) deacylase